jgi:murein DD-endopeptidase MepM/ murein hydrolase activator NlpD
VRSAARAVLLGAALLACAACAPGLSLKGKATQGGLMIGHTTPDAAVTLDDKPLRLGADGLFVFGFGRDQAKRALLVVRQGDKVKRRHIKVKQRRYDIQRIDGLPEEMVSPPEEILARIKREAEEVAKLRAIDSDGRWFLNRFIRPASGIVSGVYGSQRILNGQPRAPHYGVDFAAEEGAPVREVVGGRVIFVGDLYLTGNTVIVDHGFGVSSSYLHLKTVAVSIGETIEAGVLIGTVGSSGRATGPHLHWGLNWFDVRLDPLLALPSRARRR